MDLFISKYIYIYICTQISLNIIDISFCWSFHIDVLILLYLAGITGPYWTTEIWDKYVLELRNRFENTEKSTPNDEYENFVNAHLEAAAKCIPTKLKTKYRVPWETLAVRDKRALVKTASKNYRKNPTNTNALKLKTAQYQLAGIYIKEQTEYIQNQIDKIRDSVEDRQSRIAWQTINEVSRRKNTAKAKLKAANQQERIKLWK